MAEKSRVRINVRAFAEYLFQDGSLGLLAPAGKAAEYGQKAHRRLQERGIAGYRPEVDLTGLFAGTRLDLELSGRADGIYEQDGATHLEEIKSTRRDLADLRIDRNPAHAAQLGLYGWLYCRERCLNSIVLDLVYVHRLTEKERIFSSIRTLRELEADYGPAVAAYLEWLDNHEGFRLALIAELAVFKFPFQGFRSGQRDAAKAVFSAIRDRRTLFLQAPTGIGKTMAVLFPALKALGQGFAAKLFFFTAKSSGAAAAAKALVMIEMALPHLRWIVLTAKSKICFRTGEGGDERPPCLDCPFGRDYYTKVKTALKELFNHVNFTRTLIEEIARNYEICPFELSLDLSLYCDLIIGDYNYGFDYGAQLQRFFSYGKTDFVFLVDEAHNLVDRARSMFSGSLSKRRLMEVRRTATAAEKKILSAYNAVLLTLRKQLAEGEELVKSDLPTGIAAGLGRTVEAFDEMIENGAVLADATLDLYWELRRLRVVIEHYDNSYRTIIANRNGDLRLDFVCIDPSAQLQATLRNQRATVLFSGTLAPTLYFRKLIAPELAAEFIDLPSPFPSENCAHFLSGLSTRWKVREKSFNRYAELVREAFHAATGNLIVFSPSFAFQSSLIVQLTIGGPISTNWVVQKPSMSAVEREAFIAAFDGRGIRGFAVAGGSFAESIDLVGERLVGVLIFGLGLPQVNIVNETFREYFETKFGDGYDWAYRYPGLNRVMQAAGRVIRSETDKGFVCLVDERYGETEYRRLLPEWWDVSTLHSPGDLGRGLPAGL